MKELKIPIIIFLIFIGIGFWRWSASGNTFYLLNFGYIGSAILVGGILSAVLKNKQKIHARRLTQFLIGAYMLGFLGLIAHENMQIEGFFFYFFSGIFGGATLHYIIAKIVGPVYFGRAWCGWACWTAMVLDYLPWKICKSERMNRAGLIRYIHFFFSFALVSYLFYVIGFDAKEYKQVEIAWLLTGNAVYYILAIVLAFGFRDNRAFCKYVCPVPVTQKLTSGLAILKQEIDPEKCIECKICEEHCPMNIKLLSYAEKNQRVLSTECILCSTCDYVCEQDAIQTTSKFDNPFHR
ncbi:4Fe-4S binding protein [candidate division CSSED10-310 bacterium]|uniref:4Fe-4S binding protein n=1 Tax=candidate division CSSED10-310 bacterium TaxID=2855610 RepID=A0ABV6Z3N9_UNCC1